MDIKFTDIDSIINDALERVNNSTEFNDLLVFDDGRRYKMFREDVAWYSWPQRWSDTSCGFGGYGGQMFCSTQTVVVRCDTIREMYVYHGGRFAYHVPESNLFWEWANAHNLPGRMQGNEIKRLRDRE